jgi:hypothetical protein
MLRTQPGDHRLEVGRLRQDVGPDTAHRALVQLENRTVHLHRFQSLPAQDEPGPPENRRPSGPDEPASAHAQVAPYHHPALEAQQQVLANRFDRLEPQPVHAVGDARDGRPRVRRLRLDSLPHERLETTSRAMQGVPLGHAASVPPRSRIRHASRRMSSRVRAAAAGAVAATAWGLIEPLDRRLLRCDYSDIAVLGKAVTRGPAWRPAGFAIHALNGAAFGLAFEEVRRRARLPTQPLALAMALGEHVALYPLSWFVDRYHPARGEPGVPPLLTNGRAFLQATWRHAVFGFVLGTASSVADDR